jgi:hypothetical protein
LFACRQRRFHLGHFTVQIGNLVLCLVQSRAQLQVTAASRLFVLVWRLAAEQQDFLVGRFELFAQFFDALIGVIEQLLKQNKIHFRNRRNDVERIQDAQLTPFGHLDLHVEPCFRSAIVLTSLLGLVIAVPSKLCRHFLKS